jgi:hypothetical protein
MFVNLQMKQLSFVPIVFRTPKRLGSEICFYNPIEGVAVYFMSYPAPTSMLVVFGCCNQALFNCYSHYKASEKLFKSVLKYFFDFFEIV